MNRFYLSRVVKVYGNPVVPPVPPTTPPATDPPAGTVFTQDQVNAMMAEHKRGLQTQLATVTAELENAKKAGGNVDGLKKRIEELNTSLMTEADKAKQEQERIKNEFDEKVKQAQGRGDLFQTKYSQVLVNTEVAKAALKHDAWRAEQLEVFIGTQAKVVEVTNNSGQGTGEFKVVVPFVVDGKTVEITVDEAVGRMREDPQYGNLFKVKGSPGTGFTLNNNPDVTGAGNKIPTSTAEYMKQRAALKASGVL